MEQDSRGLTPRAAYILLGLLAAISLLVQGGPFVTKSWLWTGDYIYHRALIAEILNGELLPGGPYAGLPAFYSPLMHYAAAAISVVGRLDPLEAIKVLSILSAPLIPLAMYSLTRTLRFDRSVALLAAFLGTFGGGLRIAEDRVWVDALFTGQHNFFPMLPRDPGFLLLIIGFAWTYRALIDGWRPGAALAGGAFGLMVLVHTQTAVFAAPIMGLFVCCAVALRLAPLHRAVRACTLIAAITVGLSAFWWVPMLVSIARGGSFGVHMPAYRVPLTINLSDLPLEFGIFLPLGIVGVLMTIRRLARRRDAGALLLLVWWLPPMLLAVLRPTDFPGGDTFFPRRLWQFASQPLQVMSAYGLMVGVIRPLLGSRRPPEPIRQAMSGLIVLAVLVLGGIPGSWGTWRRVEEFWNQPTFADASFDLDGNFRYARFLAERARVEGPSTVLVSPPDATMVWYYAGDKVVYLYPTAAIKLAFNVEKLTGFGQQRREVDQIRAMRGSPDELADVVSRYGVRYVALRSSGEAGAGEPAVGLVDLPAAALRSGRNPPKLVETNHYEWLPLGEGDSTRFEIVSVRAGEAPVSVRVRRRSKSPRISGRLVVNDVEHQISEAETPLDEYAEVTRLVLLRAGSNEIRYQTQAAVEIARFTAYTAPLSSLLDRYELRYQDDWSVIVSPR